MEAEQATRLAQVEASIVRPLMLIGSASTTRNVIAAILLYFPVLTPRVAAVSNACLELITPGPTRVYLIDSAGTPRTPHSALAYHKGQEDHFIVPGRMEIELPPGHYRVHAERGPEHRPVTVEFNPRAGELRQVKLQKGMPAGMHGLKTLDVRVDRLCLVLYAVRNKIVQVGAASGKQAT